MEGLDKVQLLNDEFKILKTEIKDILIEIKEMLITLPQNISMSYSLDESGGPKVESQTPGYNQTYPGTANVTAPDPVQTAVAASARGVDKQWLDDEEMQLKENLKKKTGNSKSESSKEEWFDDEEMQLKDETVKEKKLNRNKSKAQEESMENENSSPGEKKKEILSKTAEAESKNAEPAIKDAAVSDVDILTLATFSRWLKSGMNRLGKDRMLEIIEVSAAMGGISPTMKQILLRLLHMENGQGFVLRESLSVLIDLDNILMRNKKNKEESAILALFRSDGEELHG